MHPLIARIHPAVRTALFAWLFSRAAVWLLNPDRPLQIADGAPLPGLADQFHNAALQAVSSDLAAALVAAAPWVIAELLVLFAGISVYRFARTTDLDRLAERACWLWFFNPLLALNALDWGTQIAVAAGAIAIAAVVTRRPRLSASATVVAIGARPEFLIIWPAIAVAAWNRWRRSDRPPTDLVIAAMAAPAAFSGWIAASWHLAGAADTSLRAVHGGLTWRDTASLVPASAQELIVVLALITAAVLAIRYLRRFPGWYALAAIPAAVWPLMQMPIEVAAITIAWSLPTFAHLGVVSDDRGVSRALIVGFAVAFVLAATAV